MAKIRDFAVTEEILVVASIDVEMPVHVSGDLLLVFANKDGSSLIATADGTWTRGYTSTAQAQSSALFYKFATSSSETLTLTGTSDTWQIVAISVKGAGGIHAGARTTGDASNPYSGAALTTTVDNCLIFHALATDGGLGPMCSPGFANISNGDTGSNSMAVAYTYQKTAGAVIIPEWYGGKTDGTVPFTIAISDDGTGDEIPAYVDYNNIAGRLSQLNIGGTILNQTWPASLSLTTIGSQTTVYDAIWAAADSGVNPYLAMARITPVQNAAGTVLGGSQTNYTVAEDFSSGGYYLGTFIFTSPRDWVDLSLANLGGFLVVMRDASDNYKAWTVGAKRAATTKPDARNIFCIQPTQTIDTTYATGGTLDDGAVASVLYLAQNKYGAVSLAVGHTLYIDGTVIFAGGSPTNPMNFEDIDSWLNTSVTLFPLSQRSGSATTIYVPVKFGGFETINLLVNLRTFQTPKTYDGNYIEFHVDDDILGYEFHGIDADDSIKFLSCVFTSDTPYYWRFNASHSADAEVSFAGTSVVNARVTLQPTVSLTNTTFINCSTFNQNSGSLNDCNFTDSNISCNNPDSITNSSFASSGTGHALIVAEDAATTFNIDGNTFTGYAASNGSTGNEAVWVQKAAGTVNINIINGADVPSIRTSGATVNVNSSYTLTLTGLLSGSAVSIVENYDTTPSEIFYTGSVSSLGTVEYIYSYSSDIDATILVLSLEGKNDFVETTLTNDDQTIPISISTDRVYKNPS